MKVNSLTVVSTGKARASIQRHFIKCDTQGTISRMAEPQHDPSKMPDAEQEDLPYRSLSLCDYEWDDNQIEK